MYLHPSAPLRLSASTRALTHTLSSSMTHTRVQTSDSDSSLLANDGNFASDMSDIEGGASDMDTSAVDTPMVTRMSVLAEVNRPRDDSSTSNDDVSASDDDIGPPLKCVWAHGWCGRMCSGWLVTECVVFQDCGCMYGADLYLYIKASHMNATHPHPSGCLPARAHLPTHCRTR